MIRSVCWMTLAVGMASMAVSLAGCVVQEPDGALSGGSGSSSHREKGAKEATAAVAAGRLLLKEYPPLPSPAGYGEYVALLRERCGVEYEVPALLAGVAEADFIEEVRGWNGVMEAEIRRKFGADILQTLRDEGERRWREQVDAAKKQGS